MHRDREKEGATVTAFQDMTDLLEVEVIP